MDETVFSLLFFSYLQKREPCARACDDADDSPYKMCFFYGQDAMRCGANGVKLYLGTRKGITSLYYP